MPDTPFTVIVRCSDPRLDPFFSQELIRRQMELEGFPAEGTESYITNVGGLLAFVDDHERLVADLTVLLSIFGDGVGRVVLTAHSSCGGYEAAAQESPSTEIVAQQNSDLRLLAESVAKAFPDSEISGYYLDTDALAVARI